MQTTGFFGVKQGFCGDGVDGETPFGHRTTTGPKIRQTAARVSDRRRYRRLADGITVAGIRERRQQAPGGAPRCPWSRYTGAHM